MVNQFKYLRTSINTPCSMPLAHGKFITQNRAEYIFELDGQEQSFHAPTANCCANNKQLAFFLWAQDLNSIFYPLSHWEAKGLNFEFSEVLAQWRKQWGLKRIILSEMSELEDGNHLKEHPLFRLIQQENQGDDFSFSLKSSHPYEGLTMNHRFQKQGLIKSEFYPGWEKLYERLKRYVLEDGEDSLILAFLNALTTAVFPGKNNKAIQCSGLKIY